MQNSARQARSENRRGRRSRQEILDATARVMSVRGYAGTSMSTLIQETGLPKSAFYYHFDSKAGLLAAVMERGAHEFFDALRDAHRDAPEGGTPRERLDWYLQRIGEVLSHHQQFLRLVLVLVMSHEAAEAPEALRTVIRVRDEGRAYMHHVIRSSFIGEGEDAATTVANALSHFGMAVFDGSFVSVQAEDGKPIPEYMRELTGAMAALGEALLAPR
ncbi:TetR/AcrR family transcriptional regulator [Streptomyces sp. NPDC052051]|uniref:TetR/AcrR family transcriptional regulator n=1 Tax=Streptomyces sp. NPDC052051 TaxID=3154649 RepID=UPI00342F65D2